MVFVLLTALAAVDPLTVYDCDSEEATITVLDLHEPKKCPDPDADYHDAETRIVQVIQTEAEVPVLAYQCSATYSQQVTRCGFNSITYGSTWAAWQQPVSFTPGECRKAVEQGRMTVNDRIYNVTIGEQHTYAFYSHGSVDAKGVCIVEDFQSHGVWYEESYAHTTTTILVQVIRGTADLVEGMVTFANGLEAPYKDRLLVDAFEGTIVWTEEVPNCEQTVSQIYIGESKLHRRRESKTAVGSIVVVEDEAKGQYAGLVLKAPRSVCGDHCYATHIRGIAVCLLRAMDSPVLEQVKATEFSFKPHFGQQRPNNQAQMGYHHLTTNLKMGERFRTVQADICRVERQVLHGKLQALAGADNPYSLLDLLGKRTHRHGFGSRRLHNQMCGAGGHAS